MLIRFRILILLAALGVNSSFAQRYPTLKHVDVRARVTYDFRDHFFYYSYSLANAVESIGSIESFRIDLARTANTIQYDSIGLRFAGDDFIEEEFRKNYSALSRETVLVGFQSLPSGWSVLWGQRLATISKDTEFIAPGHSVDGIIMMSRSLPGIRKCVVEPDFQVDQYFPSIDDPANKFTEEQMSAIEEAQKYYGATVGPWAPNAKFEPAVFLDTLSTFIRQSRSLNWIHSDNISKKYLGYLDEVRVQLLSGKKSEANEILKTILSNADVDSSSVITSEAYALIRYNTQYLADGLKQMK